MGLWFHDQAEPSSWLRAPGLAPRHARPRLLCGTWWVLAVVVTGRMRCRNTTSNQDIVRGCSRKFGEHSFADQARPSPLSLFALLPASLALCSQLGAVQPYWVGRAGFKVKKPLTRSWDASSHANWGVLHLAPQLMPGCLRPCRPLPTPMLRMYASAGPFAMMHTSAGPKPPCSCSDSVLFYDAHHFRPLCPHPTETGAPTHTFS